MKAMRRRVADHDVQRWAARFLEALEHAPGKPRRTTREQRDDDAHAAADSRAAQEHHSEHAGVSGA